MTKTIKSKSFEAIGLMVFVASLVASIGNYLFQILSGKILSADDYGNLYSILSVTNIAMITGSAMATAIAKNIAEIGVYDAKGERGFLIKNIFIQVVIGAVTFGVLALLKYEALVSLFAAISVTATNIAISWYGLAQGKKAFGVLIIYNLIQPIMKVAVGTLLLKLGVPYPVIFVIMTLSALISIAVCSILLKRTNSKLESGKVDNLPGRVFKTLWTSIIPMLSLSVYSNIHVIAVKAFCGSAEAGAFSIAAVFGNALLYIPASLVAVLIPFVAADKENGLKMLFKSLAYSEGLALAGGLVFVLLKRPILKMMFGENGDAASKYVLPMFIMAIPIIAIYILTNYKIANGVPGKFNISCILSFVAVGTLIVACGSNTNSMMTTLSLIYFVIAIVLFISEVKKYGEK